MRTYIKEMSSNNSIPLPKEEDKEDTTQINWELGDITIIAERNDNGLWNVYAREDDIIISDMTQDIPSHDLLFIIQEYKQRYYTPEDLQLI